MAKKTWIGMDIGGANIKIAGSDGWCRTLPFPMWKQHESLCATVMELLSSKDSDARCVLTMTGELADCFRTRDEGVRYIVDAISEAVQSICPLLVYSLDGEFLSVDEAKEEPDDVAAGNWHGLATYAARYLSGSETGLLIDIGSTTVDVIPMNKYGVQTKSKSDLDRLTHAELLYLGVGRTPICAVTDSLPYRGMIVPVMAELFATVDDCFLVLGRYEEDLSDKNSANGESRTIVNAVERLSRMIGLDSRDFTYQEAKVVSQYVEAILMKRIENAISRVAPAAETWVLSGHGTWLVPSFDGTIVSLCDELGAELCRMAPAYALACLAQEKFG